MGKTWVLDTDTKGTGAHVVPIEKATEAGGAQAPSVNPAQDARTPAPPAPATPRKSRAPVRKTTSPLGPGQVRKKSTGEIGTIKAVDPRAGTATVPLAEAGPHLDGAAHGDLPPLSGGAR